MFAKFNLRLTFTEPLLGTVASDQEVYKRFIATKAPVEDPDETVAVTQDDRERAGWTTFYRLLDNNEIACLMDYQVKGFLKEAGNVLKENVKIKALRSKIESDVFVFPRRIPLGPIDAVIERPLRAMTMQGPRVSVVRSDVINPGRSVELRVEIREGSLVKEPVLRQLLDYGAYAGLGQWRSGSYGRFTYELG